MVAPLIAATLAKKVAKVAAGRLRSEVSDMASDLKDDAMSRMMNFKNQARTQATNYLDAQKHRIYESARGALYTNTSGGNRNYRPTPVYRNVPGSNVVTSLNVRPPMFR